MTLTIKEKRDFIKNARDRTLGKMNVRDKRLDKDYEKNRQFDETVVSICMKVQTGNELADQEIKFIRTFNSANK